MFVSMEALMQNPLRALTLSVKTTPSFQMWYFVSMELSLYIEKKKGQARYESRYEVKMISQVWILQINYSYLYFLHVFYYR